MTSNQLELFIKLRYFDFIPSGTAVIFRSLYVFPNYTYERSFNTLENAIEHAKTVIIECGGTWEVQGVDPTDWLVRNFGYNGCSLEIVCDPVLYKKFMIENRVNRDILITDLATK